MAKVMNSNNLTLQKSVNLNKPELRKILKVKYNLDVPTECDKFLERCLRQKDGNIEKAAKLVQAHHQVILDFENWDAKLDPTFYDATFYQLPILCALATRDKLGRRVFPGQSKPWNPDKISFEEAAVALWMLAQMGITNEEDQKNGYVVIWDMDAFSLRQVWAVNQRKLLKFSKWIQGGVMGRVKGVYFINHPRICGLIYEGIKPFLSEKMRTRVMFHKNLASLHESLEVDRQLLPKFLGGDLEVEDYMDKEFTKNLLKSREFFQDMRKYGFPVI